jgi:hypothetical protein
MQAPREREWVVSEGFQGMETMAVLILTVGPQISQTKWEFGGYRFYPGAVDYKSPAYLYASKEDAIEDTEPVTTLKCWREPKPAEELANDLIIALSKFQASI